MDTVKPCVVLLERLTEEQINQYTSGHISEATCYEGKEERAQKKLAKYSLRDVSRYDFGLFEEYRRSRQNFFKRRKAWLDDDFTDSADFTSLDNGEPRKKKKKVRKKPAYEDDLEWSPHDDSNDYSSKHKKRSISGKKVKLRRNVRRKVIWSDSTDSSEDDLYHYMFDDEEESSSKQSKTEDVPLGNTSYDSCEEKNFYERSLGALKKDNLSNASADGNASDHFNSSSFTSKQADILNSKEGPDSDVLSKIMQEMDDFDFKNRKKVSKLANPSNSNEFSNTSFISNRLKTKRTPKIKQLPSSSNLTEVSVKSLLKTLVDRVCAIENRASKLAVKVSSKCKWCDSPFYSGNKKQLLCAICKDLKCESSKEKSLEKRKILKTNKKASVGGADKAVGSKNKIINKVLKNLPDYDKQRLMYVGKTDKSTVEKGYNHCKTFDYQVTHETLAIKKQFKAQTSISVSSPGKNSNPNCSKAGTSKKIKNTYHNRTSSLAGGGRMQNKSTNADAKMNIFPSTLRPNVGEKGVADKQKHVRMTSVDKGLFLMTFPDPDKELDINFKQNGRAVTLLSSEVEKIQSADKIKVSGVTEASGVSDNVDLEPVLATKNSQPSSNLQITFPPDPAVIVTNFASLTADPSNFAITSIYYQNEMTLSNSVLRDSLCSADRNQNVAPSSLAAPSMPSIQELTNVQAECFPVCSDVISNTQQIPSILSNMYPNNQIVCLNTQLTPPISTVNTSFMNSFNLPANVLSESTNFAHPNEFSAPNYNPYTPGSYISNEILSMNNASQIKISGYGRTLLVNEGSHGSQNELNNVELNMDTLMNQTTASEIEYGTSHYAAGLSNANLTIDNLVSQSVNSMQTSAVELLPNLEINSVIDNTNSSALPEQQSNLNKNLVNREAQFHQKDHTQAGKWRDSLERCIATGEVKHASETLLNKAYQEIDAISILGVIDLDKNPQLMLSIKLESAKTELESLNNCKMSDKDKLEKRLGLQGSVQSLILARKLLNTYGSYSKVAEHYLGKENIQIKKEKFLEKEAMESCQFAQRSLPEQISKKAVQSVSKDSTSKVNVKLETPSDCSMNFESASSVSHIERIETQIAAMNEHSSNGEATPLSVLHHFPNIGATVMSSTATAPTFSAPRNDLVNDSRETPSRGSGPRTPARPESAASQPDDGVLTLAQIKKERLEAAASPLLQCAYSQSSPSPHISNPNLPLVTSPLTCTGLPNSTSIIPSLPAINNNNIHINQVQDMGQFQNREVPPNRTVPFNSSPNLSKVLLNLAAKQQFSSGMSVRTNPNSPNSNALLKPGQIINVHQVLLPSGSALSQRLNVNVPSTTISGNQYIFKQTPTTSNGGSVVINSAPVGGQTMLPVQSSVPRQQLFTSEQVPQAYNATINQQQIANKVSSPQFMWMQNKQTPSEVMDQMFCAVCKNVATLRCKQCAKVAYCNTACAKTYWHQKHKMECKFMTG